MTDREKEILEAIKVMGVFRVDYPMDEVSALVSKALKLLESEDNNGSNNN